MRWQRLLCWSVVTASLVVGIALKGLAEGASAQQPGEDERAALDEARLRLVIARRDVSDAYGALVSLRLGLAKGSANSLSASSEVERWKTRLEQLYANLDTMSDDYLDKAAQAAKADSPTLPEWNYASHAAKNLWSCVAALRKALLDISAMASQRWGTDEWWQSYERAGVQLEFASLRFDLSGLAFASLMARTR